MLLLSAPFRTGGWGLPQTETLTITKLNSFQVSKIDKEGVHKCTLITDTKSKRT